VSTGFGEIRSTRANEAHSCPFPHRVRLMGPGFGEGRTGCARKSRLVRFPLLALGSGRFIGSRADSTYTGSLETQPGAGYCVAGGMRVQRRIVVSARKSKKVVGVSSWIASFASFSSSCLLLSNQSYRIDQRGGLLYLMHACMDVMRTMDEQRGAE
jgi:hypothetical protein